MAIVNVGSTLGGLAGGANVARLLIVISGQTAGLEQALGRATAATTGFAQGFKQNSAQIGNAMVRGITLPALALGGVSLKMAADFESAMGRVRGLTTLTAQEASDAEQKIMELAQTFPTAPNELADALYFAGSAGLSASEAMDVVEKSAGAAAIGMGEANDVAKLLIFSMNAYRSTGLSAGEAMDVFTAAIKEGTAAPDELALALGRLLPVAKDAGVTFAQAVGSIASLTNIGLPTRVAATSLRALFGGLLAPTIQANEALTALGTNADALRDVLAEAGPIGAIKWINQLASESGNAEETVRRLVPQIRAFTAVLGLAGSGRTKKSLDIFKATTNALGSYERALDEISQTMTYRFGVALNQLRVSAIEVGTALFPVFEEIMRVVGELGELFQGMPGPMRTFTAALLGISVVAGPLVKLYASLTAGGRGLFTTWGSGVVAAGAFAISLGLLISGFDALAKGQGNVITLMTTAAAAFGVARIALGGLYAAANAGALGVSRLSLAIVGLQGALGPIALGVAAVTVGLAYFMGQSKKAAVEADALRNALVGLQGQTLEQGWRQLTRDTGEVGKAFREAAKSAEALGLPIAQSIQETRKQFAGMAAEILSNTEVFGEAAPDQTTWLRAQDILENIKGTATDLGTALREGGVDVEFLYEQLASSAKGSIELVDSLRAIIDASEEAKAAWDTHNNAVQGSIVVQKAEEVAIKNLAKEYGISTDAIAQGLQKYQASAVGVSQTTLDMIAREEGWINAGGKLIGAATLRRRALEEYRLEALETLSGAFLSTAFDKEVEAVKGSTGTLVDNLEDQVKAIEDYGNAIATLQRRDVDTGVLSFLVDQGPAMVRKFAGATDAELQRLEDAYYRSLAAIDRAILVEGNHQEFKGSLMGKKLAQGIRKVKGVPAAATNEVIGRISAAMAVGKFDSWGRKHINDYVRGIAERAGVPKEKVKAIVQSVLEVLGQAPTTAGAKGDATGTKFTRGIETAIYPAAQKAKEMASGVKAPIAVLPVFAGSKGQAMGAELADGIRSSTPAAVAAAVAMAEQVKSATDKASKGSPRYFTYYLGRNLVRDLDEGVRSANLRSGIARPAVGAGVGASSTGGLKVEQHFHGDMDAQQAARKTVREVRFLEKTRGY